jgi:hypothetical protein
MTTIHNTTGSKAVNIRKNGANSTTFIASYVQIYNGTQQVLDAKDFASEKNAIKWANKVLGN